MCVCVFKRESRWSDQAEEGLEEETDQHLAQLATFYLCSSLASSSTFKSSTSTHFQAIHTHTNCCFSIHFHLLLHLFWSANKLVSGFRLPFHFCLSGGFIEINITNSPLTRFHFLFLSGSGVTNTSLYTLSFPFKAHDELPGNKTAQSFRLWVKNPHNSMQIMWYHCYWWEIA